MTSPNPPHAEHAAGYLENMPSFLRIGAALMALGVALGAFGAHGLKDLVPPERVLTFEVGVRYHVWHALALCILGLGASHLKPGFEMRIGWMFVAGIAIFGGSLYLLALTGMKWLGMITPIGGVAFIAGWIEFARGVQK